ncbi:complement factor I isoform X2 [Ambystoma mexicanum]|uniref:complement factor I isoform X2 n=1 Tax=Ambystoma mexicanum TaxID=8296 RepID=UPI0037E96C85
MKAPQLLWVLLGLLSCLHALQVTTRSGKKASTTKEPSPTESPHSRRLIGECVQKQFTQSSCIKVFCMPWERCVDGKCLCKLPYQCPKNATLPVCSVSKRSFRSYCQLKSYECLNPKERYSVAAADCRTAGTFNISLKQEDGSAPNSKGIVQVILPKEQQERLICREKWTAQEANVACRQLGFSVGALQVVSKDNSTASESSQACLNVKCRGHETSLAECAITDGMTKLQKTAEVECFTAPKVCEKKEFQCVNQKCIPMARVCDGTNDCGDLSDELCCKECAKNAFHCRSDTCISPRYRCNGEFDCINGDDESGCPESTAKSNQGSRQRSGQEPTASETLDMDDERKMIRSSLPRLTCGIQYHRHRQKRIIGGQQAKKDQFPWQVAIKDGDAVNCGGIYIGGCWVLTAAHCVRASKAHHYRIMVGLLDRKEYDEDIDSFPVIQVKVHEDYNPTTYQNDIALLQVENIYKEEKCMAADNSVMPACIPWSEYLFKAGDTCIVSGWGRSEGFAKVFNLMWGPINLMANCSEIYKERFFPNMECAGTYDGSIDSCKGDSGGPLVCVDSHSVAYIWGIVSWGENCGLAGYPGVYTKVANYFEWISRHVGRQSISRFNV